METRNMIRVSKAGTVSIEAAAPLSQAVADAINAFAYLLCEFRLPRSSSSASGHAYSFATLAYAIRSHVGAASLQAEPAARLLLSFDVPAAQSGI